MGSAHHSREARLRHVAEGALALGMVAMIVAALPIVREFAWIPALPAVLLAIFSLGFRIERKRNAALGLVLGWLALAYSVAMALWG